jgi:hypothetical protein
MINSGEYQKFNLLPHYDAKKDYSWDSIGEIDQKI